MQTSKLMHAMCTRIRDDTLVISTIIPEDRVPAYVLAVTEDQAPLFIAAYVVPFVSPIETSLG